MTFEFEGSLVPDLISVRPQHVGQAQSFGFFWREWLGFDRICQQPDRGGFKTAAQVAELITF